MKPNSWNDVLALLLLVIIPALWVLDRLLVFELSGEIIGALIATWTLIVQFYFRKAPPNDKGGPTPPSV